jgi:hypothetical protein
MLMKRAKKNNCVDVRLLLMIRNMVITRIGLCLSLFYWVWLLIVRYIIQQLITL